MIRVHIRPHWEISFHAEPALDTAALLALLVAVHDTGSIAQAAKAVKLSYRYAWGLLRDAEAMFGSSLLVTDRGRGTALTALAQKLVWADRRIAARLSPTLESLASELEGELGKMAAEQMASLRMDASHGFAVAALMVMLNKMEMPVELRYRNSTDAVAALSRRECDLAGFHVPTGQFEQAAVAWYTRWLNPNEHCLIHLAVRHQGLFVAPGNPLGIKDLRDLTQSGVRFVNRQVGSGTRMLLELMLAEAGIAPHDIAGYNSAEFTHSAVAAYIASGMADVGIGVRTAAQRFRLDFIPLLQERYFFAIRRDALEAPLLRQLITVLQTPAYHERVNELTGYDAADTGTILSLTDAFGRP
ncbi:substrate-binding domain-containing protein [Massilia sp. CF038]|uniref:helix-turn-helix transcriptional regulator n=1 Tax=Massilia sp. CF038 TaxID=1881045 RepID=UPI00090FE257|nr:substrate-binding domain-containing protein [Massilia sp. CF038]SHG40033.1 ModE molybdate transport repressor domain-containing protein [Massilia sp. CF038]